MNTLLICIVIAFISLVQARNPGSPYGRYPGHQYRRYKEEEKFATCVLRPDPNFSGDQITGTILFRQVVTRYGPRNIEIIVNLSGFTSDGPHGFHVHEYGDLGNGCASAGGHYNPTGQTHGAPEDRVRHVGDLGNVYAINGSVKVSLSDRLQMLCGSNSIVGRSVVLHQDRDDLGQGGDAGSLSTGNAGARMGCCVIGVDEGSAFAAARSNSH